MRVLRATGAMTDGGALRIIIPLQALSFANLCSDYASVLVWPITLVAKPVTFASCLHTAYDDYHFIRSGLAIVSCHSHTLLRLGRVLQYRKSARPTSSQPHSDNLLCPGHPKMRVYHYVLRQRPAAGGGQRSTPSLFREPTAASLALA